jgi:hypothetical protein
MALTKLPKNAFGTGSVDDSKIEDGTIQAVEISGTISETKLATGTIANASLSNSSITFNGTSRSLGDSFSLTVDVNWQSVITADGSTGTTAVAGNGYFIDTTSASHTFTLPSSASIGDTIAIKDYAGTFGTNVLVINRNGHKIQGVENNHQIETNRASVVLVYVDSTKGWLYTEEHNVGDLQGPSFTSATGGTITTSGNFKIHTFTGDGCFVVNILGNGPTYSGGPSNVDYLVVAGGGAGGQLGGGGGGAGGHRTTFPSPSCNAGAFLIAAQTYPITVGGGGSGGPNGPCGTAGPSGSNSVFSTITSAGGGVGGNNNGSANAASGGSGGGTGGGGSCAGPVTAGSGNTPPVSPPQGNSGGTLAPTTRSSNGPAYGSGGGGGAGGTGANGGNNNGGAGGAGTANSITGSSVTRAGGGGGGNFGVGSGSPGASGGSGGGGNGGPNSAPGNGTDGSANTGGGGGGGTYATGCLGYGGAGGKGIVIIRYKYQ